MKIGVDFGFGFTKAMSEDGNIISFPSVVGARKNESAITSMIGTPDDYFVKIKNGDIKSYYVGDAAITNKKDRDWNADKTMAAEVLRVLCSTAMSILAPEESEIDLVVGLPISLYKTQKDLLRSNLVNSKLEVAVNGGEYKIFHIKSVKVAVQGIGAYLSMILDSDGNAKTGEDVNRSCAVIDIGYRTIDYLTLEKGRKGLNLIESASGTLEEQGMIGVYDSIAKFVAASGKTTSRLEIEKAVLWNKNILEIAGKKIDLGDALKNAYKETADEIKSKINMQLKDMAETLPVIYLTGGGAEDLFEYLKPYYKQLELQDKPRFANVIGYVRS